MRPQVTGLIRGATLTKAASSMRVSRFTKSMRRSLAAAAGGSTTTASRAVNNQRGVSYATRSKVQLLATQFS